MKVLKKKLKKASKVQKAFYYISLIMFIAVTSFSVYKLIQLNGMIKIKIAIFIALGLWLLIYGLGGLLSLLSRKKKTFTILTIFTFLLSPIFGLGSYALFEVFNPLGNMYKEKITYTSNLIALKDTKFSPKSTIGMIDTDDVEGHELAEKLIEHEGLKNKVKKYEDYETMLNDLYEGEIDSCFVSSNYKVIFGSEDQYPNIDKEVKVLYEYSEEMANKDNELLNSKDKRLDEPFTMLIMGVDSDKDGLTKNQAFNGDTLIMVTFNPNTLTATMFSIPRDMYVPIACNNNKYAKINSSAAYGSTCVMSTIEQMTGIKIDYYVKMNFKGVVDLVEALGGVEIEVEEPDFWYDDAHQGQVCEQNSHREFGKNLICMKTGKQKLNGEQALAYARCRHLYAISDIARNRHQQDLIQAMAQNLKSLNNISDFRKILDAVSNNLETNMTTDQILSLYSVGADMLSNIQQDNTPISMKKTYLAYYSLPVYIYASDSYTSALGYYPESLKAIVNAMKVNLELADEKPIKSYEISYNEDYTTPLIGQGKTGGEKLLTMPNFIGYDKYYVDSWCNKNNINCNYEEKSSSEEKNSIVNQSVHEGVLLKSINTATFYYSSGTGSSYTYNDDDDEEESNNKNNKNELEEVDVTDKDKDKEKEKDKDKDEENEIDDSNNNNNDENNTSDNETQNNNDNNSNNSNSDPLSDLTLGIEDGTGSTNQESGE